MYLLIGIWGSGPKEYSAMKLTLMLMGASAVLLVGILGIYFNSNADGGPLTFNILEIAQCKYSPRSTKIIFPINIYRFCSNWSFVSISYLVTRWSCLRTYGSFDAARRGINEIRWLWGFSSSYVFVAGRSATLVLVLYHIIGNRGYLRGVCSH